MSRPHFPRETLSRWGRGLGGGSSRIAGMWSTWGGRLDVAAGTVIAEPTEVVRASLHVPLVWLVSAWVNGPTGLAGNVAVRVIPGLGKTATQQPDVQQGVNVAPAVVRCPAREVVVVATVPLALLGNVSLVVTTCPEVWPPLDFDGGVDP